jgi:hypothetical protein
MPFGLFGRTLLLERNHSCQKGGNDWCHYFNYGHRSKSQVYMILKVYILDGMTLFVEFIGFFMG